MIEPDLLDYFDYEGDRITVQWFDIHEKNKIPAGIKWEQIYVIGNYDNKVPIVVYDDKNDNLPGGHVEFGESLEDAMHREIKEELNMEVVSWIPLGYQRLSRPDDKDIAYQFRVYAKLKKAGEFTKDTGGSVIGYRLVDLKDLNDYIHYGKVGEKLISECSRYFS